MRIDGQRGDLANVVQSDPSPRHQICLRQLLTLLSI